MSASQAARQGSPRAVASVGTDVTGTGSWFVPLLVVLLGTFMVLLDTSIVTVAIPAIQAEFGASSDQVQWVATGYNLALGVVVPVAGWMGDRFGLGRIYVGSLVAFGIGSVLCGSAWSLNALIGFRVLQAVGGGLMAPITLAMVYRIAPGERIGTAMGLYGFGAVLAPTVGPTLGGYLVQYWGWRLIFYVNLPIGALGALAALVVLPRFAARPGQRFDLPGFATASIGLFAFLLALSEGQAWGWTSEGTLLLFALGLVVLAAFVVIELSVEEPMLDLRIFCRWSFSDAQVVIALLAGGLFASFFYVPVFLQEVQGVGALQAGLALMPAALVTGAMMPIAGRVYDRVGARLPAAVGLAITACGMYLLHGVTPRTPISDVVLWMSIRSLGSGLAMMPIITGGLSQVPRDQISRASSINNVVQRVAASLGLAGLTAFLTAHQAQQFADRAAAVTSASAAAPGAGGPLGGGPAATASMLATLQGQAFTAALSDVFLLVAAATAIGVPLALLLPSRVRWRAATAADAAADAAAAAPVPAPSRAVRAAVPATLLQALQPPRDGLSMDGGFPLPPSEEPAPGLAAELVRIDQLVGRLDSAVLEMSDPQRRGLLVVIDGVAEAAWLRLPDGELCGADAERELLGWERGRLQARLLPPAQARAIGWLWTLPKLTELPLTWLRPTVVLEQLVQLPGRVAAFIDRGPEAAVMLLEDGAPLMTYSERHPVLDPEEFLELMSGCGRLTVRWSEAAIDDGLIYRSRSSPDGPVLFPRRS
jgi:EmrB/QacA subfamily drug resistance transporter